MRIDRTRNIIPSLPVQSFEDLPKLSQASFDSMTTSFLECVGSGVLCQWLCC